MWSSRLFWKLFLVASGLVLALAIIYFVVVSRWQRQLVDDQVTQRLHDIARIVRTEVGQSLRDYGEGKDRNTHLARFTSFASNVSKQTETRVTLVGADGEVWMDTHRDAGEMLNHSNRPELIDAGKNGWGWSVRSSPTLGLEMHYVAIPVRDSVEVRAYVRVAEEVAVIDSGLAKAWWVFAGSALLIAAIAVGLLYVTVGRILRPLEHLTRDVEAISTGHEDEPMVVESNDEVGSLAAAFNHVQSTTRDQVGRLQKNNDQLTTVLESMDDAVIAVDGQENILFANDTCVEMLEFVTDDFVGRPLLEVTRSRPIKDAIQDAISARRTVQSEFESSGVLRRVLALRATCFPGNPCPGVVVVLHDVSELRRLESLRQELVANVSHELKTPLAAIKAFAETLRLGAINDPENNLKFVSRIEEQSDRLYQLILDMLQVARIETEQETFDLDDVPVDEIVHICVEQYLSNAELKQIELVVEPPSAPISVRADEEGLRTILINLIDNAIKYTPAGGQVSIGWQQDLSQSPPVALIEVRDTGLGIAENDKARVFERFFRVDKARSRELGGTGLGLSIVKHLSNAFGGSVSLDSEVGKGSVFRVALPISL